jgi:DNA primase
MNVKLLLLPDGDDPDSFARKHTATEYQQYLQDNQVDFITYKATHAINAQKGEPDAEERLIHNVAESIAVIPDEIKRTIYIRHAAKQLQMPERLITAAVNAKRGKERTPSSNAPLKTEEQKQEQPQQQQQQKVSPLRGDAEVSIAQMIIRYGEKDIFTIEDENGQDVPLSVAEFISYSLQDDDIHLQTPLYQQILDEAVENVHKPNFRAEQYFNNHPDEEIRELAFKLGTDSVELSKLHGELPVDDRLDEIIPSLIASYKLSIIQQSLQSIIEQMKSSEIKASKEKQRLLMTEFAQKSKLAKELAKACGERVVLK